MTKLFRDIWTFFGITILVFLLLESVFSFGFRIRDRFLRSPTFVVDPRVKSDAYSDRSWVPSYYDEFKRSQVTRWTPYVYWRQQSYQGNHINITEHGLRVTPTALTTDPKRTSPLRIFMFGGSTMWGTGVKDSMTIPAILGRELASKGITAEVTNFGESGYVNTQEVIALLLELQKEKIPDLVIFYDGVNDTFSAYQQSVAGLPQNENNRAMEFNLLTPANRAQLWTMALRSTLYDLSITKFLEGLLRRVGVIQQRPTVRTSAVVRSPVLDDDAVAYDVVAKYKSNMKLVNALTKQYGFKRLFYWQPTIFQKKHLTENESLSRQSARHMEFFFLKTYAIVQQNRAAHDGDYEVRDLSLIFSDVQEPIFVDWCHLAERGNTLIAKRMATDVLRLADTKTKAAVH